MNQVDQAGNLRSLWECHGNYNYHARKGRQRPPDHASEQPEPDRLQPRRITVPFDLFGILGTLSKKPFLWYRRRAQGGFCMLHQ